MTVTISGTNGISGADGSASTPAFQGTDTNTGIYFPGADRIGFSEGGVQVGEFDASANFKFNSGYGSVATAYGCRAWVNFNGTGTVAIRASGNVTSITDNGVGNYTVNFTNAMPDVNFAVNMTYGQTTSAPDARWGGAGANSTTTAVIYVIDSNGSLMDRANIYVSVFR